MQQDAFEVRDRGLTQPTQLSQGLRRAETNQLAGGLVGGAQRMTEGGERRDELLDQMSRKTMGRDFTVLGEETRDKLKKYLRFKQSSRFADTFDIDWGSIKKLILEIDETKDRVLKDIRSFLGEYQSRF